MSVFDLFRGFFGPPGGYHSGEGRRDPFFDGMTHDDDDEDEDDEFHYDGYRDEQDHFDDAWRFGFRFGPSGMRIEEPEAFGQVFREIEEIISQLGRWNDQPGDAGFGSPGIMPPPVPPQDRPDRNKKNLSGNTLRDFMLKSPDDPPPRPHAGPSREPGNNSTPPAGLPNFPNSPFHGWTPFSKFNEVWRQAQQRSPDRERREDGDLDSAVSSGGLDQILTPPSEPPSHPRIRSFFQSVTVTKVVKPDGSVEERRTVRDGQGNEETTVTRSGGPEGPSGPEQSDTSRAPAMPGAPRSFSDLRDDSLFSRFFGGFK